MKDAVATMGSLLPPDAGGRDAVHVAVFSATSAEIMYPGQHVAAVPREGIADAHVKSMGQTIGIVDPFLRAPIPAGLRFWVYLYPRTITGLSHRWIHPAFEQTEATYAPPSAKLVSEKWLRDFADAAGLSYGALLEAAQDWIDHGEYQCQGSKWEGFSTPDEFWPHYEAVTGKGVPETNRGNFFTCSC